MCVCNCVCIYVDVCGLVSFSARYHSADVVHSIINVFVFPTYTVRIFFFPFGLLAGIGRLQQSNHLSLKFISTAYDTTSINKGQKNTTQELHTSPIFTT